MGAKAWVIGHLVDDTENTVQIPQLDLIGHGKKFRIFDKFEVKKPC